MRFDIPSTAIGIATFMHDGRSNFIVHSLAADGTANDYLVNEIGRYAGTVIFDLDAHSVAFEILADGAWTVLIQHPVKARAWDGTAELIGKGDDVVLINPEISGLFPATFTHDGRSNFIVHAIGDTLEYLVNEIGHYSGQVRIPSGTVLLTLEADGAWTVTPN